MAPVLPSCSAPRLPLRPPRLRLGLLGRWRGQLPARGQVVETGPVLYAALEEPQPRTSGRLRMLTPDGGPWIARLEFVYDLLPLMGGGAEQLTALIEKVRPRLLVIDTLTAVVKAHTDEGGEHVLSAFIG